MPDEIKIRITSDGVEKAQRELHGVADAEKQVGEKADDAKQKTSRLGAMLDSAGASAKAFVGGFFGISAVIGFVKSLYDHLQAMRELLKELSKEAAQSLASVQDLAQQEGIAPPEAVRRVAETVRESGATWDVAKESRRAVHSAFGEGGLKSGLHTLVAGSVSRYGGDANQTNALVELLARTPGASDSRDAAAAVIAKLEAGMSQTFFSSLGEIAQATGTGGMEGLIKGAPIEEVIARQAQARAVTANADQAKELMRQINATLQGDVARGVIEQQTGAAYAQTGYVQRMGAMSQALADRAGNEAAIDELLADVPPTERERIVRYFTAKKAIGTYQDTLGIMAGAQAADVYAKNEAARQGLPAQWNAGAAQETARRATRPLYEQLRGQLREQAEERLKELRVGGELGVTDEYLQTPEEKLRAVEQAIQLERLGMPTQGPVGTIGSASRTTSELAGALRQHGAANVAFPFDVVVDAAGNIVPREGAQTVINYNVAGNMIFGPTPGPQPENGRGLGE